MREKPVVESAFNEIAGIHSKSTTLLNITFHKGGFPVNTSEFLAFLRISKLHKIGGCALQDQKLYLNSGTLEIFIKKYTI